MLNVERSNPQLSEAEANGQRLINEYPLDKLTLNLLRKNYPLPETPKKQAKQRHELRRIIVKLASEGTAGFQLRAYFEAHGSLTIEDQLTFLAISESAQATQIRRQLYQTMEETLSLKPSNNYIRSQIDIAIAAHDRHKSTELILRGAADQIRLLKGTANPAI